jgi:hypothetical protein
MSTNETPNQTTKLSAIRDHVIVSEVPVLNMDIKIICNSRKIDSSKLGMSNEIAKSLPDSVLTKFEQILVPKSATNGLEAARKRAEKVLKSRAVYNKLFGWVIGHEDAGYIEDELLVIKSAFYNSLMDEETYDLKAAQIIEALKQDPILIHQAWHSRFVEISQIRQPSWEDYINGCSFAVLGIYIGEAGTISSRKMKSAEESFQKIFTSTKGVLIEEISTFANAQLKTAYASKSKGLGVKEVTWRHAYELCDKLKGLSFVCPNIAKAEAKIRAKFIQALPESGLINGRTRDNYLTILTALADPFRLVDKVDSGLPLFKEEYFQPEEIGENLTLSLNENKANTHSLTAIKDAQVETEIESIPVMEVEEIEVSSKELKAIDSINSLEALIEKITTKTTSADDFISQAAEVVASASLSSDLSYSELMSSLGF